MALKITKRRNRRLMTTIAVKHHVDRSVVVDTIVATLWHPGTPAEEQNELTRAKIEHELRQAFWSQGDQWQIGAGDGRHEMAEEDEEEAVEWAESELVRLWPEWVN